jgi:hypothetical protein
MEGASREAIPTGYQSRNRSLMSIDPYYDIMRINSKLKELEDRIKKLETKKAP